MFTLEKNKTSILAYNSERYINEGQDLNSLKIIKNAPRNIAKTMTLNDIFTVRKYKIMNTFFLIYCFISVINTKKILSKMLDKNVSEKH